MSERNNFSHLPLPLVLAGKPKFRGMGIPNPRTNENRRNRTSHGGYIKDRPLSYLNCGMRDKKNA